MASGDHDDANRDQHLAERKEGESWHEMIERMRKESGDGGNSWERMRSLPDEQKQQKEQKGRGDASAPQEVVEASAAWFEQLREASQRGRPEQDRCLGAER